MSDQDSMTREQLEAAGYGIHPMVKYENGDAYETEWQTIHAPDGWTFDEYGEDRVLQAATAHYRQQQELFNFREFLHSIDGLLDKLSFYGSNYDALDDLQTLRDSIDVPNTWQGDAGTWEPPTVSKPERTD